MRVVVPQEKLTPEQEKCFRQAFAMFDKDGRRGTVSSDTTTCVERDSVCVVCCVGADAVSLLHHEI